MKIPIKDYFKQYGIDDTGFEYDKILDTQIEIKSLQDWEYWYDELEGRENEYQRNSQMVDASLRMLGLMKKEHTPSNPKEFFDNLIQMFKIVNLNHKWLEFWEQSFIWLFNLSFSQLEAELDPKHQWRIEVLTRDNFKCRVCGKPCNSAHHIYSRKYCQENAPELEWDVRNGVAACYECHQEITLDGRKWFQKNE